MTRFMRKATTAVAGALMLVGITVSAQAFMGFNTGATPGRQIQIKGKVVCTACSLDEARKTQPSKYSNHLYQVTHRQGQAVVEGDALRATYGLSCSIYY